METACVLCNSMERWSPRCSCGQIMLDSGPVTDYSGPYSPYYNMSFAEDHCHHLFTCPVCGRDTVISVPLVNV